MSGEVIATTTTTILNNPIPDPLDDNEFAQEEESIRVPIPSTLNMDNDTSQSNQKALEALNKEVNENKDVNTKKQAILSHKNDKRDHKGQLKQSVKVKKNFEQTSQKTAQKQRKKMSESGVKIIKKQISRQRLNVSVLNPQSQREEKSALDPKVLEAKIKQIAKQIRSKVKKDPPRQMRMRATESKTHKTTKRKEKYLTPLKNNTIVKQFSITSPQSLSFSTAKNIGEQKQKLDIEVPTSSIVKNILKRDIFQKVNKQIDKIEQANKIKLKLDPIKHHYPMTSFRKSVLKEDKSQHLKQLERQKEKEAKLLKRKEIFNNSRYHRYTQVLRKSRQDHYYSPQINQEVQIKQQNMESNVFSVDLTQEEPENQEQRLSEEKQINKIQEKKMGVASSIQELDNIIQDMMYSNQSVPKESKPQINSNDSQIFIQKQKEQQEQAKIEEPKQIEKDDKKQEEKDLDDFQF